MRFQPSERPAVYISHESTGQTQARLQCVLAQAEMLILPDPHAFVEVSASRFPVELVTQAIAFVRDEDVWSALVPSSNPKDERFVVFGSGNSARSVNANCANADRHFPYAFSGGASRRRMHC